MYTLPQIWECEIGGMIYSSPIFNSDQTIMYIGGEKGFFALRTQSGNPVWEFQTNEQMFSAPAVGGNGVIYTNSTNGNLYAFLPNGRLKWIFETGGWNNEASPTLGPDGTIYFGSDNGMFYALKDSIPVNTPPQIISFPTNIFIYKDSTYTLSLLQYASDPDDNILHWTASPSTNIVINIVADTTALISSSPDWIGSGTIKFIVSDSGGLSDSAYVTVSFGIIAPVEKNLPEKNNPPTFKLNQNYPNPFNPETSIRFQIPETSEVHLTIYDLQGRMVRQLVDEAKTAGNYSVIWNGTNRVGEVVPTGTYFYKLEAGNFSEVKKMVLLK